MGCAFREKAGAEWSKVLGMVARMLRRYEPLIKAENLEEMDSFVGTWNNKDRGVQGLNGWWMRIPGHRPGHPNRA